MTGLTGAVGEAERQWNCCLGSSGCCCCCSCLLLAVVVGVVGVAVVIVLTWRSGLWFGLLEEERLICVDLWLMACCCLFVCLFVCLLLLLLLLLLLKNDDQRFRAFH